MRTWGLVESVAPGLLILRDGNSMLSVRYAGSGIHAGDFVSARGVYTLDGDLVGDEVIRF